MIIQTINQPQTISSITNTVNNHIHLARIIMCCTGSTSMIWIRTIHHIITIIITTSIKIIPIFTGFPSTMLKLNDNIINNYSIALIKVTCRIRHLNTIITVIEELITWKVCFINIIRHSINQIFHDKTLQIIIMTMQILNHIILNNDINRISHKINTIIWTIYQVMCNVNIIVIIWQEYCISDIF